MKSGGPGRGKIRKSDLDSAPLGAHYEGYRIKRLEKGKRGYGEEENKEQRSVLYSTLA